MRAAIALMAVGFTLGLLPGTAHAGAEVEPDAHVEEGHGHGHAPSWDEINWAQGFLGENADAPPGLLWRKPGTPAPFGAMLLNSGILFFLIIRFGGPKISEALKARKQAITQGMRQAADMREEAQERLADYEEKLAKIDEQVELAKRQIRDLAKAEREQVLREAKERRDRMEREARLHIEQELKAARELLMDEAIRRAVHAARLVIAEQATPADEHRLQEEYLTNLRGAKLSVRGQA